MEQEALAPPDPESAEAALRAVTKPGRNGCRDSFGRWLPGVSGNPAGTENGRAWATRRQHEREIRDACRLILLDPDYRQSLYERLLAGRADHIESKLWEYAYGRPAQTVQIREEGGPRRPATLVFLDGGRRDPLAEPESDRAAPPRTVRPAIALPEVSFEADAPAEG